MNQAGQQKRQKLLSDFKVRKKTDPRKKKLQDKLMEFFPTPTYKLSMMICLTALEDFQ